MFDTLSLIARFCHLRVSDVAIYFKISEHKARRKLNSLERDKFLLVTERPDCTKVYGLSATGRNFLKVKDPDSSPASSLKYLRGLNRTYEHRCIANRVCINFSDYCEFSTEYEIQTLRAPISSVLGKVPDCLLYPPEGVIHCEIERSKRNESSWQDLIRWVVRVFHPVYPERPVLDEAQELYLRRVDFFCDQNFEGQFFKRLSGRVGELRANELIDCYIQFNPMSLAGS
jgi:hypothetical protein